MNFAPFESAARALLNSLNLYSTTADREDFQRWLDSASEAIATLGNILPENLSRGEKQKRQTCITQFLCLRHRLIKLLEKKGGDLEQRSRFPEPKVVWDDFQSAFENRISSGVISNLGHLDIISFMNDAKSVFIPKIKKLLDKHPSIKVNSELAAEYILYKDNEESADIKYFNTENVAIFKSTNLDEWFETNVNEPIQSQMESFESRGSGFTLNGILRLTVNCNKFNALRASSYIPLPREIENKKACINVKNEDQKCFLWAILSALHTPQQHTYRVSSYNRYEKELNFKGIEFPVSLKQIEKFEKQNPVSVNVYMLKKNNKKFRVDPCHLTKNKKQQHVNLLLIQNENAYIDEAEEECQDPINYENYNFHYVYIKNLSRLVSNEKTKHHGKIHICDRCLSYFYTEDELIKHTIDCEKLNHYRITLPSPKDKIEKFKNFNNKERVPFVVYADFECLLEPVEDTRAFQHHKAHSIGFYVSCNTDKSLSRYEAYRQIDEDEQSPAKWFIDKLCRLKEQVEAYYKNIQPMDLTYQQKIDFYRATRCHICKKNFQMTDIVVKDHCHLTGRYRGPAHQSCNLNYQDSRMIPVIYHNLAYDLHFLIVELARSSKLEGTVKLIAENKEKYISFTKNIKDSYINFRFIDSFRFMPSSLEKLASYLDEKQITKEEFTKDGYSAEQIELLLRKGVYPYDFTSSFESLQATNLPEKELFFNKLNDCHISDEDHAHAQNVWNTFNIDTLGSYSDLYLKTDVLLLADIFENFRSTCMEAYGLDPAHYHTTPGLTWDAMKKMTNIELESLTDINMVMFIERGIRGGISQVSNRHGKSNNRYLGNKYDPEKEENFLIYLDANNLYGWSMSQYLPKSGFQWVKNVDQPNFFNISDNSPIGYIIEADLEIPQHLHDYFADLPMLPEHMTPPNSKQEKLLTTLFNKERYVLHYRVLKQALKYGIILKKIHRALEFKQEAWLKPYVDFNTDKRKEAKNEFEKMFYKLMINAVYGKTMENERKRVDVKLVHKWHGRYSAEALIARPNFHSRSIFCEDLVAIQLKRTEVVIRKPIYIGLSVLDISKILMYDFHYSFMKQKMGDHCKLLYTDTDSLIYDIHGFNIYEIIKENLEKFDTSDYEKDNIYDIPRANKKVIGLFKDECNGKIIEEFIGLRSKMYCIRIHEETEMVKKAKGVKSRVVKNKIFFEDYSDCLFNNSIVMVNQNVMKSRLHVVHTEKQEKIGLSPKDDKRYLLPNTTDTLPWGHYKIPENIPEPLPRNDDENIPEPLPRNVVENILEPHLGNVEENNLENDILLEKTSGKVQIRVEPEAELISVNELAKEGPSRKVIPVIDLEEEEEPPSKKQRLL